MRLSKAYYTYVKPQILVRWKIKLEKRSLISCMYQIFKKNALIQCVTLSLLLIQLTVVLHLFSSMELWTTKIQWRGQKFTSTVGMGLPWRDGWHQYVKKMAAGIPPQSAHHKQACIPHIISHAETYVKSISLKIFSNWIQYLHDV